MTKKVLLAMLSFSIMVGSAQASKLVVMGINLNGDAPAGQKIYTIGMDTEGASGSLALGNIIIKGTGAGGNPLQSNFDVPAQTPAFDYGDDNPNSRQEVESLGTLFSETAFKQFDTWFYASPTGQLLNAKSKVITTDPIVGATGSVWLPQATGITGGQGAAPEQGSGTDFIITATYGTFPSFVAAGIYPVAQIRTSGDVQFGFGPGTKLSVQPSGGNEVATNVLGGDQLVDPQAFLSFSQNTITNGVPEPASLVLAGLGLVALVGLARRRRR